MANNRYFDDYPLVGPEVDGQSMEDIAMAVMSLLGWKVKTEGKKAKGFTDELATLGVLFDFTAAASGKILVRNKRWGRNCRHFE